MLSWSFHGDSNRRLDIESGAKKRLQAIDMNDRTIHERKLKHKARHTVTLAGTRVCSLQVSVVSRSLQTSQENPGYPNSYYSKKHSSNHEQAEGWKLGSPNFTCIPPIWDLKSLEPLVRVRSCADRAVSIQCMRGRSSVTEGG